MSVLTCALKEGKVCTWSQKRLVLYFEASPKEYIHTTRGAHALGPVGVLCTSMAPISLSLPFSWSIQKFIDLSSVNILCGTLLLQEPQQKSQPSWAWPQGCKRWSDRANPFKIWICNRLMTILHKVSLSPHIHACMHRCTYVYLLASCMCVFWISSILHEWRLCKSKNLEHFTPWISKLQTKTISCKFATSKAPSR